MMDPPEAGLPVLRMGSWEGTLDRLLDLARAQRVDPARIPVLALAEAAAGAVAAALTARRVLLPTVGDWLVAAASLLALRAQHLAPPPAPAAPAEAGPHRDAERQAALRLAAWLETRAQLGREIFARGMPDPILAPPPRADLTALLRACLALLEMPAGVALPGRPAAAPLWRVADALAHLRGLLPGLPAAGLALARCLPPADGHDPLRRRAALASALMAGLELSRRGEAVVAQDVAFGEIRLAPAPDR